MALIGWVLLLFLAVLNALEITSNAHGDGNLTLLCHPDQAASLLQLKKSFSFYRYPSPLESWQDGTDCCLWEGVGCSNSSGHVIALELSGRGLYSSGLDPAIFNLASLQRLDLSMNSFGGYRLPASGFERLSLLTHLNLSSSGFTGQIPIGIGRLSNLISLDLSGLEYFTQYDPLYGEYYSWAYGFLKLEQPNFRILVTNLNNLRELYLDFVDMSSSKDWCHTLAKSLPDLRVLSLSYCKLVGPICPSLSTLHALTVINLEANFDTPASPFPEFFMDFLNLSVLNLAYTNLQGLFPRRTFRSQILRVLDLSGNQDLSGHVPNTSSVEAMMLDGTNFSFAKQGSFSNFKYLKTLSLDVNFFPMESQYSLGIFESLQHLELTQMDSTRDSGSILSWIFSQASLSSVVKLKGLRSLILNGCSFTRPFLFGNLVGLTSLEISGCRFNGPMPSEIGNLTNLKRLIIESCDFSGPIPSSIGNLVNLRSLEIYDIYSGSGRIPSALGNLSNLESLEITFSEFSGPIPYEVGLLKKLTSLSISDCGCSGSIPDSISLVENGT